MHKPCHDKRTQHGTRTLAIRYWSSPAWCQNGSKFVQLGTDMAPLDPKSIPKPHQYDNKNTFNSMEGIDYLIGQLVRHVAMIYVCFINGRCSVLRSMFGLMFAQFPLVLLTIARIC